jgi:predicted RNase H-like nuclease (RuvC/YqgF family)
MKRSELEAMGLSKENVDAVMKINGDDIENAKSTTATEMTNLKAENDSLSKQIKDRDTQLEELKKSAGNNEDLQKQIQELQNTNTQLKESHETEMQQMKLDAAVEKALTDGGAKNIKAAKALLELTDAKFDKDGAVKGLQEQIDKIKTDESLKFMFNEPDQTTQQKQTFTGFQPGTSTTVPNSAQAGYEARLAEARKNGNQLEVIKIKQEAFEADGTVLM